MRKLWMGLVLTSALLVWSAAAQTSVQTQGASSTSGNVNAAGAQAGASSNTSASGSGNPQGVSAGAENNTSAGAHANAPQDEKSAKKEKGKREKEEPSAAAGLASGTTINAELSKGLDSKKSKPGDPVTATVTQDVRSSSGVVIRRGTKLMGHVTQAKARAKGDSDSSLGILFDKAIPKKGPEIPLNATIQAMTAAQANVSNMADMEMGSDAGGSAGPSAGGNYGGGGGPVGGAVGAAGNTVGGVANTAGQTVGGAGSTAGGAVGSTTNAAGNVAGSAGGTVSGTAGATLNAASSGVVGMKGLNLTSNASNATEGSVVTSTGKSVHLDGGTQLLLKVTGQ